MTAKSDGGPAFPCVRQELVSPGNAKTEPQYAEVNYPGMSLRDHFAIEALVGILSNGGPLDGNGCKTPSPVAEAAYNFADAMLAERAK